MPGPIIAVSLPLKKMSACGDRLAYFHMQFALNRKIRKMTQAISPDNLLLMTFPNYLRYLNRLGMSTKDLKREYDYLTSTYIWHVLYPYPNKTKRRKITASRKFFKDWGGKMKKSILGLVLIVFVLAGCGGINLSDERSHQAIAYTAGRLTAIGVYEVRPEADSDLTNAWVDMIENNEGQETVSTVEMVAFFNECSRILTGGEFDKYGLVGDLTALMSIYSAEIDKTTGQMITIKPVSMVVLISFADGYAHSRALIKRQKNDFY